MILYQGATMHDKTNHKPPKRTNFQDLEIRWDTDILTFSKVDSRNGNMEYGPDNRISSSITYELTTKMQREEVKMHSIYITDAKILQE